MERDLKNNLQSDLKLESVKITDKFWLKYISLVKNVVLPYQWEILNDRVDGATKSYCIHNFLVASGEKEGEFGGMVFQDSDLYKWLEAVGFALSIEPDEKLEQAADYAISLIEKAQQPDGYVNTYFICKSEKKWSNLQEAHELYCAGHLIEAAVAYFNATKKDTILKIACKLADCIDNIFGVEEGKLKGYPGHQEIELALYKLYKLTNNNKYLSLAKYFIDERGKSPNYFAIERESPDFKFVWGKNNLNNSYSQSHIPPVEQTKACGHAVRAVYMYSAMADLAGELKDERLLEACRALYDNIVDKQMYITGAIGSVSRWEGFSFDYDLPNDLIYGETCASIGLMMFAQRMSQVTGFAKYADTVERALYNTVLSGMSLTGKEFFYVNPLEVEPKRRNEIPDLQHIKTERQGWFGCACCPPNISRAITSLGNYIASVSNDCVYLNLFISSEIKQDMNNFCIDLNINSAYPFENHTEIIARGGAYKICLRSPSNSPIKEILVDGVKIVYNIVDGYAVLESDWNCNKIEIFFDMKPELIYTNPLVKNNNGKVAVQRGPFVYCAEERDNCAEEEDNREHISSLYLKSDARFNEIYMDDFLSLPAVILEADGFKIEADNFKIENAKNSALYSNQKPSLVESKIKMIPYFMWGNRGENEMRVFLNLLLG